MKSKKLFICYSLLVLFCFFIDVRRLYSFYESTPICFFLNPHKSPSLVNSIDFHPTDDCFVVTFTHNNVIGIYRVDDNGKLEKKQYLKNPQAKLKEPQHAIFIDDGRKILVANWSNETFNVYRKNPLGDFEQKPVSIISYPKRLKKYRPHGISLSPKGKFIAVAFGASKLCPKAIAIFEMINLPRDRVNLELRSLLETDEIINGIPKGITFSPDGMSILVTFSQTNAIGVYSFDNTKGSCKYPFKQFFQGDKMYLSRPEDIKFHVNKDLVAVTNSTSNTVVFYHYDPILGFLDERGVIYQLENPTAGFCFPHGLSFSSNGKFLAVTQFGSVKFNHFDDLESWGNLRADGLFLFKQLQ